MIRWITLTLLSLAVIGCGKDDHDHDGEGCGHDDHAHNPKHGGHLIELGQHEGFLEVKVDHKAGKVMIWSYMGEEMKDTKLTTAPTLNLKTKAGPKQIKGAGSGHAWTFTDAALKDEPEGARFVIAIGGKTYNAKWEDDHDHDHADHDDDHDHDHEDGDHDDHDEDGHDHDDDDHKKDGGK